KNPIDSRRCEVDIVYRVSLYLLKCPLLYIDDPREMFPHDGIEASYCLVNIQRAPFCVVAVPARDEMTRIQTNQLRQCCQLRHYRIDQELRGVDVDGGLSIIFTVKRMLVIR